MKNIKYLTLGILILLITSCGAKHRYKIYKNQESEDIRNPNLRKYWDATPSGRAYSYSTTITHAELYMNDPAYDQLGFSPYRNNAKTYKEYYQRRMNSWKTLWGILN
jgi:hypothetical protein